MADAATPIGDADFARRMAQLGPWPHDSGFPVAVAVSGGADSLCLAVLARRWRRSVVGLIVDHGLRPESRTEAQQTRDRLTQIGMDARILTLDLAPGPALSERARTARYDALTRACIDIGALDLLLGHHADDQRETAILRARARSGPDGLACMAASTTTPDIRLVRPLLGWGTAQLRARLQQEGLAWVEDPSNRNPRWQRARIRAELAQAGVPHHAMLTRQVAEAGAARMQREADLATDLAQGVRLHPEGWATLPGPLPPVRVLARLIRVIGGGAYEPAADQVAALHRAAVGTLGGARLMPSPKGGWFLLREAGAIAPAQPTPPGGMWDGRFRVGGWSGAPKLVGALGDGVAVLARAERPWPAALLRTLPCLWQDGHPVAIPHLGWCADATQACVRFDFWPRMSVSDASIWDMTQA